MIISTFLILPPAIVAFIIYLWMYYELDPEKRLTDLRMLLAIACVVVIMTHMVVIVQQYDRAIPSMISCAAAFGLLICAIVMRRRQPFGMIYNRR
jgi:uncharacterized membrane protein